MQPTLLKDCPFCDPKSPIHKHALEETANFRVVCDRHPVCEGHIMIIPKSHFSCAGELPPPVFEEFKNLFLKYSAFLKSEYGSFAAFERGRISQMHFHSNFHLLPYAGTPDRVIREGFQRMASLHGIDQIQYAFEEDGGYLFISMRDSYWLVDPALGGPHFFRERFAEALGTPGKADWEKMSKDKELMKRAEQEIKALQNLHRHLAKSPA